ncbi:MAG: hypothetical protein V3T05_07625 [Myxococcota bacterium]
MRLPPHAAVTTLLLAAACSHHPAPPPLLSAPIAPNVLGAHASRPHPGRLEASSRAAVVARARALLNGLDHGEPSTGGITFGADPVGCVQAAYWAAELDLVDPKIAADETAHGMEILFRSAAVRRWLHKQTPKPGDLVFFDRDRRESALYPSQAAVVDAVRDDGTVSAVGCFADGPARVALNLREPSRAKADDRRINDVLSGAESGTAAQLFRAFADPFAGTLPGSKR